MPEKRPSEWPVLFDLAINILEHFKKANGFTPQWTFGGGTALMLQIDHRESHDIDLFLDDPQLLPFLNPETQGIRLERAPDSYQAGTDVLKLAYSDLGSELRVQRDAETLQLHSRSRLGMWFPLVGRWDGPLHSR